MSVNLMWTLKTDIVLSPRVGLSSTISFGTSRDVLSADQFLIPTRPENVLLVKIVTQMVWSV